MIESLNYSSNSKDELLLYQLDQHLQSLTSRQKAAIAVVALYEATEPLELFLDYDLDAFSKFNNCVSLIVQLSLQGKLAVTRAIAEELAVLELLVEVKG